MSVGTEERLQLIDEVAEDLLREIQLSFWVDFTGDDLVAAETIGDLFDCVERKMGGFDSPKCLSSLAFYRLRRALVDVSGLDRRSIVPVASLQEVMPSRARRAWWDALQARTRFSLRPLQPTNALCRTLGVAAVLIAGGAAVECLPWLGVASWPCGFVGAFFVYALLFKLTTPLHREFPEDIQIFKQLVRMAQRDNYRKLAQEAGGSTRDQAWTAFRELVGAVAGIDPWAVNREMRFPEDVEVE
ncbi:MAG: hypothetical protein ABSH47_16400 [Bryobacteraceae bacterium]